MGGGSWASGNPGERGGLKNDPIRQGVWIFSGITHLQVPKLPCGLSFELSSNNLN